MINTHYYKSYLIWCTASSRVDEVIPSDHPRREALRVIQWYDLIHETTNKATITIISLFNNFSDITLILSVFVGL